MNIGAVMQGGEEAHALPAHTAAENVMKNVLAGLEKDLGAVIR